MKTKTITLGKYEIIIRKKPVRFKRKNLINIYLTKQQLRKKVIGCLRSSCDQHPEIPRQLVGSMAKRVTNQILSVNGIPEDMIED